jgi:hypothetical protein
MLSGQEIARIRDALVNAFTADELDELVLVQLSENLANITSPGRLNKQALDLVMWAERRGIVADLVRAAYAQRPKNTTWQELHASYGAAPAVSVQSAGAAQPQTPQRATANALERIVKPHLKFVDMHIWRERLTCVEGQVCRVELDGNPLGTAFLVGPDLALTNFHVMESVIANRARAPGVIFRFDFKRLSDGTVNQGVGVGLAAENWLVDVSPYSEAERDGQPEAKLPKVDELDFALVRLGQPIGSNPVSSTGGAPKRGWVKMSAGQPALPAGAPIIIAQHPQGEPIKLALDMDAVLGLNENGTRVRYATNTEPGSSGSPCFDLDWTLVALHHMGDPSWRNPQFNEGVPISLIQARPAVLGALPGA